MNTPKTAPASSSATVKPRMGFVGVGRMGANLALHLRDQGYPIAAVFDVHRPSAAEVAEQTGAAFSATLAGVTAAADLVFTVVTDDAAQRAVYSQADDNLLTGAAGKLFINCATVSPAVHVEIERLAEAAGAASLEACMASSIPQARDGKLFLMCGGRPEIFERARPVLAELSNGGELLRFIGPAGTAGQVKALVNMVMNINTAGLAEGLGLGSALGLDLAMLVDIFAKTGAASRVLVTDGEDMVRRDHACYFSAAHAAKDSGIALALGEQAGVCMPLAAAAKQQFQRMVELGLGDLDKSGVAELTFPGRLPGQ